MGKAILVCSSHVATFCFLLTGLFWLYIGPSDCHLHQTEAESPQDSSDISTEVSSPQETSLAASPTPSDGYQRLSPGNGGLKVCDELSFQSPIPFSSPESTFPSITGNPSSVFGHGTSEPHAYEAGNGNFNGSNLIGTTSNGEEGLFGALYSPSWGLPGPKSPRKYTYEAPYDMGNSAEYPNSDGITSRAARNLDTAVITTSIATVPDAVEHPTGASISLPPLDTMIPAKSTLNDLTFTLPGSTANSESFPGTAAPFNFSSSHDVNSKSSGLGTTESQSAVVSEDRGSSVIRNLPQQTDVNIQDMDIMVPSAQAPSDTSKPDKDQSRHKKRKLDDITNHTSPSENPKRHRAKKSSLPAPDLVSINAPARRSKRSSTTHKSVSMPATSKGKAEKTQTRAKPGWDLVERGDTPPPTKLAC
jgi:hypothetical protein